MIGTSVKTSMLAWDSTTPSIIDDLQNQNDACISKRKYIWNKGSYHCIFDRTFIVKPGKKSCGVPISIGCFYKKKSFELIRVKAISR